MDNDHAFEIFEDGDSEYIACKCGYGHALGDDDPFGHAYDLGREQTESAVPA